MNENKELQYQNLSLDNFKEFYNSFNSVDELIKFTYSRERSSVRTIFSPSNGKSLITAVIPTKSSESPISQELSKKLSKINVLWVESDGALFNFSYAMNVGIREALKIGSEFIMLSNDDIFPIDDPSTIDNYINRMGEKFDLFFPQVFNSGLFISPIQSIYRQSILTTHYFNSSHKRRVFEVDKIRYVRSLIQSVKFYSEPDVMKYIILRQNDPILAYHSTIFARKSKEFILKRMNKLLLRINNIQPISIIRASLLESETFDESFVNGGEDVDLSVRLSLKGTRVGYLSERFQNIGGYSLGTGIERTLRNTFPEILILGYKLNKYFPVTNGSSLF